MKTKNSKYWLNEGDEWLEKNEYQKAIECYEKAIKFDLDNDVCHIKKGLALFYNKEYKEAIWCYDKAKKITELKISKINKEKIIKLSVLDKYQEELDKYEKDLELYKNNADLYKSALEVHNATEAVIASSKNVVIALDEQITANKNMIAVIHYYKGLVLEKSDKYKEAIKNYECALALNPNDYDSAARRNIILLNMLPNEKNEYKNEKLKEFDKILNYGFATAFSNVNKNDLVQKILNNPMSNDNIENARQRIDKTMTDFSNETDYETRISKCKLEEFPIILTIYYYIIGKISSDTAYTLLLYFAKKMNDEKIKELIDVLRKIDSKLDIVFTIIEFAQSLQDLFKTEIWKEKSEYVKFKEYLTEFLREERKILGDEKFTAKYYYFEIPLKEYRKIFE